MLHIFKRLILFSMLCAPCKALSATVAPSYSVKWDTAYRYQLYATTGFNNALGIWGFVFGYRPRFMKFVEANVGWGWDFIFMRLSAGIQVYPLHEKKLSPYFGTTYIAAISSNYANDSATWSYNNLYFLEPVMGVRYRLQPDYGCILQVGYPILLNQPRTYVQGPPPTGLIQDYYYKASNRPSVTIGFFFTGNHLAGKHRKRKNK